MKTANNSRQNKLAATIAAMTATERRSLGQFIESPFFNRRADVLRLYQWMLKEQPLEPKEPVFAFIYRGEPFNGQKLRLVMSYLQQLAEQFLAYREWQDSPGAIEIHRVKALRRRGLQAPFREALKTARNTLERQPLRNSDYFLQQEQMLWEEARFESLRHPMEVRYLEQLSEQADRVWVIQKLRYFCLNRTQRTMYKTEHALPLRPDTEAIIERCALLQVPAIATWYYCLKMLEEPEAQAFFSRFKQCFLESGQLFDPEETRDLYLFALNYCIRRVNDGQRQFFHDIMDLYKDGLEKGYLFDKGVLSRYTYHNIVAAGLQTEEFEWVEDFIGRYRNALERTYRDSSYSFNRARLEFSRKRYDAALALLQHSNYYDPLLSLAAKTMALKIYYELGEYDLLHAHLEALKNYIRRKSMLGYHRDNYLKLVRYTQKLITVNPFNKADVRSLKQKIADEPVLTEREWLLDQLP